jgi:hypothetical protein
MTGSRSKILDPYPNLDPAKKVRKRSDPDQQHCFNSSTTSKWLSTGLASLSSCSDLRNMEVGPLLTAVTGCAVQGSTRSTAAGRTTSCCWAIRGVSTACSTPTARVRATTPHTSSLEVASVRASHRLLSRGGGGWVPHRALFFSFKHRALLSKCS